MALPDVIASKTIESQYGSNTLVLTSDFTCNDQEQYKTTTMFIGFEEFTQLRTDQHTEKYTLTDVIPELRRINGRAALIWESNTSIPTMVSGVNGTVVFSGKQIYKLDTGEPVETTFENAAGVFMNSLDIAYNGTGYVSTNIPVFATGSEALQYINAASDETALLYLANAINYELVKYEPEKTKVWTYSSRHANVTLTRGNVQENSNIGYRTLKFQSNTEPAFYIIPDTFEVGLIAPDIVASVYAAGPEQVADNIPDDNWTEGELAYTGPFYTSVSKWIRLLDETPPDGDYVYPVEYQTNIPVFANREDAEEAIRTGDYSKAGPAGVKEYDVKIGDEEEETEFGGGGFMSPFFTILSGGKTDIHRLADFLFTDDQSLWDNIKKGLEMYGSNPIDYIISLKAFPFNVDRVVNESPRSDIWFGSYQKHFDTPFNEVINMAHKYIDAGSFFMYPIQYCYLDFEPYTTLSAYFPYHGWEQLDIKKYYQKNVNVRYYVDILTGQAIIVTVCDGVITDQFGPCEIGTELPLTGANFAQWAQGQVRLLTQSASSILGGVSGGVTSGNVAGFAASSLTSLIPASQALQEAKHQGGPKNTMITKGNFGSNLGNYLPGYVIFRFDIHEMLEPDLLQPLAGRPSYSSGVIRSFSGFISGKVVKMDTSGMSDSEANRIKQMIMNGIYV